MNTALIIFCALGAIFFGLTIPTEFKGLGSTWEAFAWRALHTFASLVCVVGAIAVYLFGGSK